MDVLESLIPDVTCFKFVLYFWCTCDLSDKESYYFFNLNYENEKEEYQNSKKSFNVTKTLRYERFHIVNNLFVLLTLQRYT